MKANNIIIVPETHWDREWYLPFQEFRAKLVIMMDKLLDILKTNSNYKNFTLDGQIIPLEDYLEVRPNREEDIKNYVKEGRLSIGPMYVLPDEFLVSGESLIRNLLIGHQIGQKYGKIMRVGYIPDPFGHIAQIPQILQGFEIPSILFWRGFGNQFEEKNLNVEFIWNAPGRAASLLAVFLIKGYGSLAELNTKTLNGEFKPAFRKIKNVISDFENYTATPYVVLNSGTDHFEARPQIPDIIKQWNNLHPEKYIEQADFEYYVNKVLDYKPQLKEFQGELRGGRYAHLLSGVFSARMWIKQRNTAIEYLYEKYSEPLSTITWVLDKNEKFIYPKDYLITGLKWLQKNAPHDSICGCSIDEVHNEMVVRFDWAEQIANEVYKSSFLFLSKLIEYDRSKNRKNALIVFNPLPWKRRDKVEFNTISRKTKGEKLPNQIKIIDHEGNDIDSQYILTEEEPRFSRKYGVSHKFTFLAEVPACGYKTYYIIPIDEKDKLLEDNDFKITRDYLENEYYRIDINLNGSINVYDKNTGLKYENVCEIEDVGDWGDEYDFSGPLENQTDLKFSSGDAAVFERSVYIDGPTHKCFKLRLNLKLPYSLTEDRYNREDWLVDNKIQILISLYQGIKRIDFQIQLENNSRDHRIRMLFPTNIKSDTVNADGHFYVVARDVKMPESSKWVQKPLPTNHQKDFVSVSDNTNTFAILNKGLPEYEAIINQDDTITFAITLLRCVEWLSRDDFITRKSHAGPGFKTPGAQCLGEYIFELSFITESKSSWLDSQVHVKGKEFNNPLKPIFPNMVISAIRSSDKIILRPSGIISYFPSEDLIKIEPYLPPSLSFLEIDNKSIVLSALKKSEIGDFLIIRLYNISSRSQKTRLSFDEKINIKKAELVNFLEESPQYEIKASIINFKENIVDIGLEPHVITTLKFECEF